MARHPVFAPPAPLTHSGPRLRLWVLIGVCVLMAGWFAGLTTSRRGWLAIGLAWLLVALLGWHYRDGGRRWLVRVASEYAVVALLVLLVATTAGVGGTQSPAPARHPNRPPPASAGDTRPSVARFADDARAWLRDLWRQAGQRTNPAPPTTTTTPHHHAR